MIYDLWLQGHLSSLTRPHFPKFDWWPLTSGVTKGLYRKYLTSEVIRCSFRFAFLLLYPKDDCRSWYHLTKLSPWIHQHFCLQGAKWLNGPYFYFFFFKPWGPTWISQSTPPWTVNLSDGKLLPKLEHLENFSKKTLFQ